MAVAHKILIAAYHMLRDGEPFRELGETYLDRLGEARITHTLVRRLERLGYKVDIRKAA